MAFMLLATFSSGAGELPESIKKFIDNKAENSCYEIDNEYLLSGNVLPLFYVNRVYVPAWFDQDAFMLLGSHLYYGKVNPENEGANWKMQRKDPEPGNALGRVKFMFPNTYNVYIQDTPSKSSFALGERAISSGCIRVEKPFDLAVLLLSDSPEWSPANILNAMQQDKEQTVKLKIPIDVVLTYLTAWTDGKDRIQFRKDIYLRDEMVLEALNQKPEVVNVKTIL